MTDRPIDDELGLEGRRAPRDEQRDVGRDLDDDLPLDTDLPAAESVSVTRSEERLVVGAEAHEAGKVRIIKRIEQVDFDEMVPYSVEHAEIERIPAQPEDSGEIETLADGTVSIPVMEEQLVVQKRLVVTERLLVRKRVETREQQVTATLDREVITVDADEAVDDRVDVVDRLAGDL